LLFVALTCIGCASQPVTTGIAFDSCTPHVVGAPNATAEQSASVDDAIAMWNARGVVGLSRDAAAAGDSIRIVFRDAGPADYGAYDDTTGTIFVNVEVTDRTERAITVAHELGHAFALVHVTAGQRASVMNPGNLTVAPNDGDQAALDVLWGACTITP
jgi:hypothetical protein